MLTPGRLCANVNSPSLTTRAVKYSEHGDHSVLTHQPQYAGVGLFPSVQLNKSAMKLPTWSPGAVSRLTSSYSFLDRSQILSENRGYPDQSTKNVLEVLREISRKRIHSDLDDVDEETAKRQRKEDGSDLFDTLSNCEITDSLYKSKRTREESPKQDSDNHQQQPKKRICNNEILSSLSSSRNMRVGAGVKRKTAAADWSRSSTPVFGKQFKKGYQSADDILSSPSLDAPTTTQALEKIDVIINNKSPRTYVEHKEISTFDKEPKKFTSSKITQKHPAKDCAVENILVPEKAPQDKCIPDKSDHDQPMQNEDVFCLFNKPPAKLPLRKSDVKKDNKESKEKESPQTYFVDDENEVVSFKSKQGYEANRKDDIIDVLTIKSRDTTKSQEEIVELNVQTSAKTSLSTSIVTKSILSATNTALSLNNSTAPALISLSGSTNNEFNQQPKLNVAPTSTLASVTPISFGVQLAKSPSPLPSIITGSGDSISNVNTSLTFPSASTVQNKASLANNLPSFVSTASSTITSANISSHPASLFGQTAVSNVESQKLSEGSKPNFSFGSQQLPTAITSSAITTQVSSLPQFGSVATHPNVSFQEGKQNSSMGKVGGFSFNPQTSPTSNQATVGNHIISRPSLQQSTAVTSSPFVLKPPTSTLGQPIGGFSFGGASTTLKSTSSGLGSFSSSTTSVAPIPHSSELGGFSSAQITTTQSTTLGFGGFSTSTAPSTFGFGSSNEPKPFSFGASSAPTATISSTTGPVASVLSLPQTTFGSPQQQSNTGQQSSFQFGGSPAKEQIQGQTSSVPLKSGTFSFGSTTSSTLRPGGLSFGGAKPSQESIQSSGFAFGSNSSSSSQSSPSSGFGFGSNVTQPQPKSSNSGFNFNSNTSTIQQSTTSGGFELGNVNVPVQPSKPSGAFNFGSPSVASQPTTTSDGGFSSGSGASIPQPTTTIGGFGFGTSQMSSLGVGSFSFSGTNSMQGSQQQPSSSTTFSFGSSTSTQSPRTEGFGFGSGSTQLSQQPLSGFAAAPTQSSQQPLSVFGATPAQSSQQSLSGFGAAPTSQQKLSGFGITPAQTLQQSSGFGTTPTSQQQVSVFGVTPAQSSQQSSGFGSTSSQPLPSGSVFNFGNNASGGSQPAQQQSSAGALFGFGSLAAAPTAQTQVAPFNFNTGASAVAPSQADILSLTRQALRLDPPIDQLLEKIMGKLLRVIGTDLQQLTHEEAHGEVFASQAPNFGVGAGIFSIGSGSTAPRARATRTRRPR
uniref:Uncharacterized protein n=1 Tax=Timema bartmani TaxID=61472 RepID=A0A7R9F0S1_9NEOP|nr:unnamed protein product [Timema bartmani]